MRQLLPIPFGSLNESDDPKTLPPGTFTRLLNCRMDKGRRLSKRLGTTGLTKTLVGGGSIATGRRLVTRGKDLALFDGTTLSTRIESLALWQKLDRPSGLNVTRTGLVDSVRSIQTIDIATYGDWLISFYLTANTNSLAYDVRDLVTGTMIVAPTAVGASANSGPRVLVSGTVAYFFFAAAGTIEYQSLNLVTLAAGASGSLVVDARVSPSVFDVVIGTPTAGVPTLYLVYELAAGANRLNIVSFTVSTMVAIATLASLGTGIIAVCIAFCAVAQRVAVNYSSTTSVLTRLTSANTFLAGGSQVGPTTIYAGVSFWVFVAEDDGTNLLAGWDRNDGSSTDADRLTTALYSQAANAIVATSRRITFGVYFPSKPWRSSGRWYLSAMTLVHPYSVTTTDAIAQVSSVVLEVETADSVTGVQDSMHPHVATLANQTGWFGTNTLKSAVDSAGNIYIPASHRNLEPPNYTSTVPTGWDLYRISFDTGDAMHTAKLIGGALLSGGAPGWYDGAGAMPYGFSHAPQIISVSAAAGGAIIAGDYSYVVVYEWRDANGLLHRSVPSVPKTGTTAGANLSLVVKVATSSLSSKQKTAFGANATSPVYLAIYRTTIGGTGPHYRLSLAPALQILVNNPQVGDVSLTDTKADADIGAGGAAPAVALASQPQLYTDLGELADVPPPGCITCTTHRGRLVVLSLDKRTVAFSKDSTIDPTLAPGFNEALQVSFANDKVALASLDEKLVVFGETTIDVVNGDGPDDTGDQNTWSVQGVQTDVGCGNPLSVVASPIGVLFQDPSGRIMILERGLSVAWIGSMVTDTLAAFPNITSAVLVAAESEIRFTCVSDDGLTGAIVVWDYMYKTWLTRKYNDASDTADDSIPFADAALIDGVYTLLTYGGQVYRETDAHRLDGGTVWVERDIILAPISPGGAVSWNRVKDLGVNGTSLSNHDLEVSLARDYATSYETVSTFLAGSAATAVGPLEKCRVTAKTQKCQAIGIRIRDLTPTNPGMYPVGTGDGPNLEALALRVGVKTNLPLTSAGQQEG